MGVRGEGPPFIVPGSGIVYDTDAQALFTASGQNSAAVMKAISDFYAAVKATSGLYAKMYAWYFLFQGSASLNKWNGIDPRDLDAAYRLTFTGGIVHASTGMSGNGTTGFADTKFAPSGNYGIQRGSHGVAINTTTTTLAASMGCNDGAFTTQDFTFFPFGGGTDTQYNFGHNGGLRVATRPADGGFFCVNRGATVSVTDVWRNGTKYGNTGVLACDGFSTRSMYLLGSNQAGTLIYPSTNSHWFSYIGGKGSAMTDADVTALSTAVANLQTALGI